MVFNNNKIMHVITISEKGDHETVSKGGTWGHLKRGKRREMM